MRSAASLSTHPDAATAVGEIVGELLDRLGESPDACFVFASGAHGAQLKVVCDAVRQLAGAGILVGARGQGVVGGRQVEHQAALSVWAATLDDATPVHFVAEPDAANPDEAVVRGLDLDLLTNSSGLALVCDPGFPARGVVDALGRRFPTLSVGGGVTAGAGDSAACLVDDGGRLVGGAVGLAFGSAGHRSTSPAPSTIVSQGAWPVANTMVVTASKGHVIEALSGSPASEQLDHVVLGPTEQLGPEWVDADPDTIRHKLRLGVVYEEHADVYSAGDFVVHPIVSVDRIAKTVEVDTEIEPGTIVQFHLIERQPTGTGLGAAYRWSAATSALVFGASQLDESAGLQERGCDSIAGLVCTSQIGPAGRGPGRPHLFTGSNTALLL